jgi:hypothetical protein
MGGYTSDNALVVINCTQNIDSANAHIRNLGRKAYELLLMSEAGTITLTTEQKQALLAAYNTRKAALVAAVATLPSFQ